MVYYSSLFSLSMIKLFNDFVNLSLSHFNICCVQFWAAQYKREMDILERDRQRVVTMIKGLEYLSYE